MTSGPVLEHIIEIAAPPEHVYGLWTTPSGLASWWAASAEVDARPGGVIRVDLGGPVMVGSYVVLDPPHHVRFTFGWETDAPDGPLPAGSTTVDVTIEAIEAGSQVTLRHFGLPVAHRTNHERGWNHFLARMNGGST